MYTGNECIDCIGFFATFPLIHPDQVYPNSTNIRSIGMVVKDQVIKWDHLRWRVLRPYLPVALVMKFTIMLSVHVMHYNLSLPMIANS